MITVTYNSDGIRVDVGEISKYNKNLPLNLKIKKHISGEEQWSSKLDDYWYATFPNTEMFDVEIYDNKNRLIYKKVWDVMEHGNHFYKSLWLFNKSILSKGKFPKGLVIGTHDGEFGEWVPIVESRECNVILVEASDKQFEKLKHNYRKNSLVNPIQKLVTPNGGEVEFFEGGEGYTNTVVENVIRSWETEKITSKKMESISITNLILNECGGHIDWLHLDVEGLDAQLIMGIDESKVSLPNFIIFEDYNLGQDKKDEIYSWFHSKGYQTFSDGGICEAIKQ
jgi:FkbM family methyltransferase